MTWGSFPVLAPACAQAAGPPPECLQLLGQDQALPSPPTPNARLLKTPTSDWSWAGALRRLLPALVLLMLPLRQAAELAIKFLGQPHSMEVTRAVGPQLVAMRKFSAVRWSREQGSRGS